MQDVKVFVVHCGETDTLPDEFSKDCYEIVDGRQFALNAQMNEASAIKHFVDNPPDVDFIGFAHYRRHLQLPESFDAQKTYASKMLTSESVGDMFARFHSAKMLDCFIDSIDDKYVQHWFVHSLADYVAFPRNIFIMGIGRFKNSFSAWFNSCYNAAASLCDECKRFGSYNRRIPGFLMERATSAYIAKDMGSVVLRPMVTYDNIASPWQRGPGEMATFIDGHWKGEWPR